MSPAWHVMHPPDAHTAAKPRNRRMPDASIASLSMGLEYPTCPAHGVQVIGNTTMILASGSRRFTLFPVAWACPTSRDLAVSRLRCSTWSPHVPPSDTWVARATYQGRCSHFNSTDGLDSDLFQARICSPQKVPFETGNFAGNKKVHHFGCTLL